MNHADIENEVRTLENFEEWLESQGRAVVGHARNTCRCPLANYLKTVTEGDRIEVAADGIAIGDGRLKHSSLSKMFTRWIDDGRSNGEPVTAAQARQELKRARKAIFSGGAS